MNEPLQRTLVEGLNVFATLITKPLEERLASLESRMGEQQPPVTHEKVTEMIHEEYTSAMNRFLEVHFHDRAMNVFRHAFEHDANFRQQVIDLVKPVIEAECDSALEGQIENLSFTCEISPRQLRRF